LLFVASKITLNDVRSMLGNVETRLFIYRLLGALAVKMAHNLLPVTQLGEHAPDFQQVLENLLFLSASNCHCPNPESTQQEKLMPWPRV